MSHERVEHSSDDWDGHWEAYDDAVERNPAQAYRRRLVLELLSDGGPPQRILDLGSGQGDLLGAAARRWPEAELVGIEPSRFGVAVSRSKAPRARFEECDILQQETVPPGLEGWASHLVCSEVFEHVDDDLGLLRASTALMQPGCRVVVTVPGGKMSRFDEHIGHRRHYTIRGVSRLLESAGLEVELATGAGYPFFNLYRAVVIARGEKLMDDVAAAPGGAAQIGCSHCDGLLSAVTWNQQAFISARNPDRGCRPLPWYTLADLVRPGYCRVACTLQSRQSRRMWLLPRIRPWVFGLSRLFCAMDTEYPSASPVLLVSRLVLGEINRGRVASLCPFLE